MAVDNLILRDRGSERFYSLQDVFNCTAIADATGTIQERYGYNAFGLSGVMDAGFNPLSGSSYDWETRYDNYRFDSESNFYQVRNRYLHPTLGRWLTRDPIGYEAGINLYAYCKNQSVNNLDSNGLDCPGCDSIPSWVHYPANHKGCADRCCAIHDECYATNTPKRCESSSWGHTLLKLLCHTLHLPFCPKYNHCDRCNLAVISCFLKCLVHIQPPAGPKYYCAKECKYITIGKGGDFKTLQDAMKCCCSDKSDPPCP
jgi:RHS repeat-associated protein